MQTLHCPISIVKLVLLGSHQTKGFVTTYEIQLQISIYKCLSFTKKRFVVVHFSACDLDLITISVHPTKALVQRWRQVVKQPHHFREDSCLHRCICWLQWDTMFWIEGCAYIRCLLILFSCLIDISEVECWDTQEIASREGSQKEEEVGDGW